MRRSRKLRIAREKTYSVSSTQWLDVEECKDLVTLEDFEGWDVTCFIEDQSCSMTVKCTLNRIQICWKEMMFGLIFVLGTTDIVECGGAPNNDTWRSLRTLDDFAEDAGWGCHLGCLNRLDVGLIWNTECSMVYCQRNGSCRWKKEESTSTSKELEMTEKSGARSQLQQPPPIFSLTTSSDIAVKNVLLFSMVWILDQSNQTIQKLGRNKLSKLS